MAASATYQTVTDMSNYATLQQANNLASAAEEYADDRVLVNITDPPLPPLDSASLMRFWIFVNPYIVSSHTAHPLSREYPSGTHTEAAGSQTKTMGLLHFSLSRRLLPTSSTVLSPRSSTTISAPVCCQATEHSPLTSLSMEIAILRHCIRFSDT